MTTIKEITLKNLTDSIVCSWIILNSEYDETFSCLLEVLKRDLYVKYDKVVYRHMITFNILFLFIEKTDLS